MTAGWIPVPHHAVQKIQKLILDGRWSEGDRLPSQRELAEELKISRASLREALSMLETLGFLRVEPGRGTFVAAPEGAKGEADAPAWRFAARYPLRDVYQTRFVLEGFAAGLAATALTPEQLALLEGTVRDMREAAGRMDLATVAECDFLFHRTVFGCCGNRMLSEISERVRRTLDESRSLPFANHSRVWEPIVEHEAILRAFQARDPAKASAAMQDHVIRAAGRVGVGF